MKRETTEIARGRAVLLLGIVALTLATAAPVWGSPSVFFDPGETVVVPADTFLMTFRVDAPEDSISGYQLYLSFDPGVVSLEAAEQGSLYAESGHTTWFRPEELAPGVWRFFDTVMGENTYVAPPGELLRLTFAAVDSGMTQAHVDTIRLADVRREDLPVGNFEHGEIEVLGPTGVDEELEDRIRLGRPSPNPFGRGTSVSFGMAPGRESARAGIYDVAGRLVRRLSVGTDGDAGLIRWDGRDAGGRAAPPAVYFMIVSRGADRACAKLVKVR